MGGYKEEGEWNEDGGEGRRREGPIKNKAEEEKDENLLLLIHDLLLAILSVSKNPGCRKPADSRCLDELSSSTLV